MLKELRGHVNAINSLAFSPDGRPRLRLSGQVDHSLGNRLGDMVKKVQYKNISYHSVAFVHAADNSHSEAADSSLAESLLTRESTAVLPGTGQTRTSTSRKPNVST